MKIVIITQEDSISIPKNIEKIARIQDFEIKLIVNINSKYSLANQKKIFIKSFGLAQVYQMGLKLSINKLLVIFDLVFGKVISISPKSLFTVSRKYGIPYKMITNPNDDYFLSDLEKINPDIIVSFSAPVVFKEKLLNIPKFGCINLHCSMLPNFAGVMPSFWTLYKKQKKTGVTVHFMDKNIDDGDIIGQKEVYILPEETIYSLVVKTKEIGGDLMCEVLSQVMQNKIKRMNNDTSQGSYFSWPKVDDFKNFKKQGGRLI